MFSKFQGEEKYYNINQTSINTNAEIYSTKINNNTIPYNANQSGLVKLNIEECDKDLDFNEEDIDKIEEKIANLNKRKINEYFIRENQISKAVDEIIEVPKKKMKDEVNILSDDKRNNQIKKQIRELENEQDKEKRKIEIDKNIKKKEDYRQKLKLNRKNKKKALILFIKYIIILFLISGGFLFLIINLNL